MSDISSANLPTYTISVGTPGVFTDESSTNVAQQVNAEISSAPVGEAIDLIFNPGSYGISSTILLPSNTEVSGNDATLQYLPGDGPSTFSGPLIANADSHQANNGPFMQTNLIDGTTITFPDWNWQNTVCESESGTIPAVVDHNISIQGITFSLGSARSFADWITNATDVSVQDNTYIGGVDGNAFVDVVNSVAANNICIGQYNAALDNWNGPTNTTVEDNQVLSCDTGWSVLMNSTPSGNPNNPGNAVNDGIVDNLFSSGPLGNLAVNANALQSYGFTSETLIVQQGNIDSANGLPGAVGAYSGDALQNMIIENDIASGLNDANSSLSSSSIIVLENTSTGNLVANDTSLVGNVAEGTFSPNSAGVINNSGNNPSTTNNLEIGAGASSPGITTDALAGSSTQAGNIEISTGAVAGMPVTPLYDIKTPASVFMGAGASQLLSGISIEDSNSSESLSVTLMSHFGSLSSSASAVGVQAVTFDGETGLVLSGSVSKINNELNGIGFTSNSNGWDDSVELILTSNSSVVADRYIPVIDLSGTESNASLITLSSSALSTIGLPPGIQNGTTYGPEFSGSSAVIAPSGDHTIDMGSTVSLVFLGSGSDTVFGGTNTGYITTGAGTSAIDLLGGGSLTIAGGPGTLDVNAATGNNLIQPGAGDATVTAGSGINTIIGGLGDLTVSGGTGSLLLETLPQDGGALDATLGTGGGTIYALSGDATLSTNSLAADLIYLGLGKDSVASAGNDVIYTGAGDATIDASNGGTDTVFGGTGKLSFIGGANPAVIAPAVSSDLVANGGNLTVLSGGSFSLTIDPIASGHRVILLPGLSNGVTLSGYMRHSITAETVSNGILSIDLKDGTTIELPHIQGETVRLMQAASDAIGAGTMPNSKQLQPSFWKLGIVHLTSADSNAGLGASNALSQISSLVSSLHSSP